MPAPWEYITLIIWKMTPKKFKQAMEDVNAESSNLVAHARTELEKAGLFDNDSDYDGMLGSSVLELVKVFSKQGHSGYSAATTVDILSKLLCYENLTPLTDDPDEWMDIAKDSGSDKMWQSRRRPDAFSEDGGKSYFLLDAQKVRLWSPKTDEETNV